MKQQKQRTVKLLPDGPFAIQLLEHLNSLSIRNNCFTNFRGLWPLNGSDNLIPDEIRGKLIENLGFNPIPYLVGNEVEKYLEDLLEYDSEATEKLLPELISQEQIQFLLAQILKTIDRIPYHHAFVFELPEWFGKKNSKPEPEYKLSEKIKIVFNSDLLKERLKLRKWFQFEKQSALASLLTQSNGWNSKRAYLVIELDGYSHRYEPSQMSNAFVNDLKAFVGCLLALNLTDRILFWDSNKVETESAIFDLGGRKKQVSSIEIPHAINNAIASPQLSTIFEAIGNDEHFYSCLLAMRRIFSDKKNQNLRLSVQWYFDAVTSSDDITSYVQATIAMESLYGDSEDSNDIGIGALLANRFAYSTATTKYMRDLKISEFKRLYKIRCKIVHSGKNSLNTKERSDSQTLRLFCAEAISVESGYRVFPDTASTMMLRDQP